MSEHFNFRSILGRRFGQIVVISEINSQKCIGRCDCGVTKEFYRSNLKDGKTTKCHKNPRNLDRQRTLSIWHAMIGRCLNPNHPFYTRYDRPSGHITVCDRWLDFENFLADMGYAPLGLSLERIDNDGHYEPFNCKWATQAEQLRNTRRNHLLTFQGRTQTVIDWAAELGINHSTLYKRLNRSGWSAERALTT